MKKILLICLILFSTALYSQEEENLYGDTTQVIIDTIHPNVYNKVDFIRLVLDYPKLKIDEDLELVSANHGLLIAIHNLYNKSGLNSSITLPSRIKDYTDREFTYCKDTTITLREQPTTDLVVTELLKSGLLLDVKARYFGFWIVKYEDMKGNKVWYLVVTITD